MYVVVGYLLFGVLFTLNRTRPWDRLAEVDAEDRRDVSALLFWLVIIKWLLIGSVAWLPVMLWNVGEGFVEARRVPPRSPKGSA